jgi:dynein heavy chain 1
MENALESIDAQLKGEEVTLAMDVLKHAKRFHATVSFIADTGLKEATDIGELPDPRLRANVKCTSTISS